MNTIHPSAIDDEGAEHGAGTSVWHFSHVSAEARIGERCAMRQNAHVGDHVAIGHDVRIRCNVPVRDAVTPEYDVFCGPSRVSIHVHDPRAKVPRKSEYRRTLVRQGTPLGDKYNVVCGAMTGRHASIGAGPAATRGVPNFAPVAGVPARQVGWMSRHGERLALRLAGDASAAHRATGETYRLADGVCRLAGEI